MKTRILNIIIAFAGILTLSAACQREDIFGGIEDVPAGYKTVEFMVQVPDMEMVQTRAVDPDGGGVQQLTVFCFDINSLFITTVTAKLTSSSGDVSLAGTFKVTVPDHTKTLQIVGNQNLTYFKEDAYRGMSEVDVMASLEASAGRMIYWARETLDDLPSHNSSATALKLLRNQAKITLSIDNTKTNFIQKGWVVVNSNAFGTVAPFSSDHGGFIAPTIDNPFVTLPDNRAKLGDYLDVRTNAEEYIFETENTAADPIDFIVKGSQNGGEDLYYRISLIDEKGNNVMILRNHHYTVNIVGDLYYGQRTFDEALEAPATNNVWVSVSDEIAEISDNEYRLAVDQTYVVIGEDEFKTPNTYYLYYDLESYTAGETLTAAEVSWVDGNDVAFNNFTHTFENGRGTILITLNQMNGLQKREGTLLVKKGRLSRKIKIITIKEQTFEPAWITANVYGGSTGENITMMFTIPDDCPQELFPMDVLVSVNDLDVRNESGMALPIIRKGEPGYGEDNGIGYKYVLTVTETGKQRVYLETILNHDYDENIAVKIEAKHFESLTKNATIKAEVNQYILLHNLRSYSAVQPADEVIYFYLVPQKIGAEVSFTTHLGKDIVWNDDHTVRSYTAVTAGQYDEFLIYSKYLDHDEGRSDLDFIFYPMEESLWSTGGRVFGFVKKPEGTEQGAVFHMVTNTPRSAEVVRIASNPAGSISVVPDRKSAGILCQSAAYRSSIFELANFHPFHFSATVKSNDMASAAGTIITGENPEVVDYVELSYLPEQQVNIEFDVTSFTSTIRGVNGNGDTIILPDDEQESVDPFGTAFDIYIDAPMLELDKTSELYTSGKVSEHPTIEGRYIYHVAASRDAERSGTLAAAVSDSKTTESQIGERKSIPFKTKSIVSAGDITISSDESKVVYYQKNFKVQNASMTGVLRYRASDGVKEIPAGSFVPFEVLPTYNRIGTISVGDAGAFELRLRSEYEYTWNLDQVKLQFTDSEKNIYEKTFDSLSALYISLSNGDAVILEPQSTNP